MEVVRNALVKESWVICPICGKRQFKVCDNTTIHNLEFRCKRSRRNDEHFMLVNFNGGGKKDE